MLVVTSIVAALSSDGPNGRCVEPSLPGKVLVFLCT